ncbi:thioredoxin family protein [Corallibacter vietnamensis]|uniref:Thioredoxin family protein n=1 Tax=Corallibacter vietnamensis TaxID=904130 RepID=A0ABP7GSE9_9FLAO
MQDIIKDSLKKHISYSEYTELMTQLVADESTTGADKTEALINYTKLNERRMKRWDKTIKLSEDAKTKIAQYKKPTTWLVLTESWCGDAAHVIPAINKVANENENINLKLVFRDENDALMNQFLTNGGKSIPKLVMIDDETGNVVNTFGPRPSEATKLVSDYKETHGVLTPEFKEDLQRWYNKDKGQNAIADLLQLLDV